MYLFLFLPICSNVSISGIKLENEIGLIVQMGRHNKKVKQSIELGYGIKMDV